MQWDARIIHSKKGFSFSKDPPYYDNINNADLSDFFYVWLRRALKPVFPDLFVTLAVPKAEELWPHRTGTVARRRPSPSSSMNDSGER